MINFIGRRKIFFIISIVVILAGVAAYFAFGGVSLALDFQSGTAIRIDIGQDFDDAEVKTIVEEVSGKSAVVQKIGASSQEAYIKTEEIETSIRDQVVEAVKEKYSLSQDALLEANNVSASASEKSISDAINAIGWSLLCMLVYITFRFSLKSGLAAVVGLVHNVLVMVAIYAVLQIPIGSSFIAAILTIVGYSINDTIVVFDKVRENAKRIRKSRFAEVANISINETLTRTLITGVTTLFTITTLYVLGVDSIKEFALPIIIGILVGTYSSICIATPIWTVVDGMSFGKKKKAKRA